MESNNLKNKGNIPEQDLLYKKNILALDQIGKPQINSDLNISGFSNISGLAQ